jgi:hypothetical protein
MTERENEQRTQARQEWTEIVLATSNDLTAQVMPDRSEDPAIEDLASPDDGPETAQCAYVVHYGSRNYDSPRFGPDEFCEAEFEVIAGDESEFCPAHRDLGNGPLHEPVYDAEYDPEYDSMY